MKRSRIVMMFAIAALLALAIAAQAGEKKLNGKELYRNNCKGCHGENSPAGEYTPMFLIQEQWERFFAEEYVPAHKAVVDTLNGNKPVTEIITDDMLKKIHEFCIEGAADSEHPMTCG